MQWPDYSLIDCGGQEKLERFGTYILRRPEPQAIWSKQKDERTWAEWDASFSRNNQDQAGGWIFKSQPLKPWWINVLGLKIQLQCTSFGHVGIFPEQISNWVSIQNMIKTMPECKLLNLFGYTGVASLIAKQAGADVYHVDAVSTVLTWARINMEASSLNDIRWVAEDAFKFVTREVTRAKSYHGIILDPPAYGRGPKGEKWTLPDQIDSLLSKCALLLKDQGRFIILNMYSMGYSASIAKQLLSLHFPQWKIQGNELILKAESKVELPLGIYSMAYK
ncbi:MAG: class I SAM-dependent methyltransferase [Saprospiraceae bacterium]